ncbi:GTP-binding protein REM 1-like isoform X2 [Sorex fumeus]|uniref:GTP-binding protein REM 1-like isoform X2 n=1 Tax=Sorex fumeus TaxID=62283 RepID=UPI0024AD7C16|nr:GTP-binding protein REM 1-like isoform X2 [Sorex fumeus]
MTLNTQQGAKTSLQRRASTPLPLSSRGHRPGLLCATPSMKAQHPRLGQSVSLNPPARQPSPAPNSWSSESSDSEGSWEALYRVVLLGDPGVGKTSLASLFAGKQERELHEQLGEEVYERTLTVDGEDTTLVVVDAWEAEKLTEAVSRAPLNSAFSSGAHTRRTTCQSSWWATRQTWHAAEKFPWKRVARAPWCSTASSSRRRPRCSTTWLSSSRASCANCACAAGTARPGSRRRPAGALAWASARAASWPA